MSKTTRFRTAIVLTLMCGFIVFTTFMNMLGFYQGWYTLGTYVVMAACMFAALRWQDRLPFGGSTALMLVPYLTGLLIAAAQGMR